MKKQEKNLNTLDVLINAYEKKLEVLKLCKYYHNYFKKVRYSKNSFLVELRTKIGKELYNKGATLAEVGKALGRTHCTIMHNRKTSAYKYVEDIVAQEGDYWIENGLYPVSHYRRKYKEPSKVEFKLIKLDD